MKAAIEAHLLLILLYIHNDLIADVLPYTTIDRGWFFTIILNNMTFFHTQYRSWIIFHHRNRGRPPYSPPWSIINHIWLCLFFNTQRSNCVRSSIHNYRSWTILHHGVYILRNQITEANNAKRSNRVRYSIHNDLVNQSRKTIHNNNLSIIVDVLPYTTIDRGQSFNMESTFSAINHGKQYTTTIYL